MRYPHGEIAGDGKHLAIPGKMSSDNSPAVCVWNIKRGSHKFLASPQPFCPFRWFEKVDVSQGRVFGLLNRRCLLAWNADNGEYLFRLDLTENAPGLNEVQPLSFTYLTVHKHLFATIHQNPYCQAVYEIDDDNNELNAVLLDMDLNQLKLAMKSRAEMKVCDVYINDYVIVLHVFNCSTKSFEGIFLRLDMKLDFSAVLLEYQRRTICLESIYETMPGAVVMNSTKFLNITSNRLYMYDFLK
jgi:hypothetical protein